MTQDNPLESTGVFVIVEFETGGCAPSSPGRSAVARSPAARGTDFLLCVTIGI